MIFDAKSIISRLKSLLNIKTDEELSAFLGVARTTISSWKQRNTLDIQLIIEKCGDIDYNHILVDKAKCVNSRNSKPNDRIESGRPYISNKELLEIIEPYLVKIGKLERTIEILKEHSKQERLSVSDMFEYANKKSEETEGRLKKSTIAIP